MSASHNVGRPKHVTATILSFLCGLALFMGLSWIYQHRNPARVIRGSGAIPFELKNNIIIVKGKLNGTTNLTFIIDCAASETVITPKIAALVGIKNLRASGGYVFGKANSVKIGTAEIQDLDVVIYDPPQSQPMREIGVDYSAIIGYSFLSKFRVTLDYQKKIIRFSQAKKP